MAQFTYKEYTRSGAIQSGTMKAASKKEVEDKIKGKGSTPIKIEKKRGVDLQSLGQVSVYEKPVKTRDIAIFCNQFHVMLNAGMNVMRCIEVLEQESENKQLKEALDKVGTEVQKGFALSKAFKDYPKVFPQLLVRMVEAGELTGNLDNVMASMSEHYTKEDVLHRKITGSLIYPIILSIIAVLAVILVMTTVVPTFVSMFDDAGMPLPGITLALIAVSNFFSVGWPYMLGIVILIGIGFSQINKFPRAKYQWDKFRNNLWFFGKLIRIVNTSRFTRTLSTLLNAGLPIITSLDSAARVTNDMIVEEGIADVIEEIKKGRPLHVLLREMDYFPQMMISMVSVGEEAGDLEEMLAKTADYYDVELEAALSKLVSAIEPIIILIMGVVVGFIIIGIMVPVFQMSSTIQ